MDPTDDRPESFAGAAAPGGQHENRRTVTILFADLVGSTALGEELDSETLAVLLDRYAAVASAAIEAHGGTLEKFIGDAVMAVFGVPTIHEDDALRAARAAIDLRAAVEGLSAELGSGESIQLELRIGINTGEVVAGPLGTGARLVTGDAVNTAARLQSAAAPGEILLGPATEQLLRPSIVSQPTDELVLKGKRAPVIAHRLLAVEGTLAPERRRFDQPLIGRGAELAALRAAFEQVATERSVGVATILGLPGVGKSRLVAEFVDLISHEATIARGRCLPYGEGITYWPLREALLRLAAISDVDSRDAAVAKLAGLVDGADQAPILVRRLSTAVGLSDEPAPGEEIPWAVRRTFQHLAVTRPVVWIVDDLQWAQPALLDLIGHIADLAHGSSILLVAIARPELAETRPDWLTRPGSTLVRLESLPINDSEGLVDALAPEASTAVRARIAAAVEGNPLFAEQLVAHLREDGRLLGGDDRGELSIPPSIGALLAARIDKLKPAEGSILGRAAVVGRTFWWGAVSTISPESERVSVGASLGRLVRAEFLRPDSSIFADDEAFRFRHLLVRDAAYSTLPKRERASLHEHFADWLEGKAADRVNEYADLLGYHLEQALRYRAELGDGSDATAILARRAAGWLSAAGRRSFDRGDMAAAADLLGRAASLLPENSAERLEMVPDLALAQFSSGRLAESSALLDAAITRAHASGPGPTALRLEITRGQLAIMGPGVDLRGPEKIARDAIQTFERIGDLDGLRAAWELLASACWGLTQLEEALEAREMARAAAERGGLPRSRSPITFWGAECYGPLNAAEAIPVLEAAIVNAPGDLLVEVQSQFSLSGLFAMQGRMADSRSSYWRTREIFDELGMRVIAQASFEVGAVAELAGGDPEIAEGLLRRGITELDEIGIFGYKLTQVSLLAVALQRQGRFLEAIAAADEVLTSAGPDDHPVFMFAGMAKAESLVATGDLDGAVAASQIALDHGAAGDFVPFHADALMAHGSVRRALGDVDGAIETYRKALAMYQAKGHLPGVARATANLSELAGRGKGS
jgi:class 3 adenylate cyclase/tetratricopeptide (TPR) repeat protein